MSDFQAARLSMVQSQLHPMGVIDEAVLDAFSALPREVFVPQMAAATAYTDSAIDLGRGRFLPAPLMVARMMQALHLTSNDHVLVVGSGTGYTAAVVASLVADVTDYEPDAEFEPAARAAFQSLEISNVTRVSGPPIHIPKRADGYDTILFDGAVAELPYDIMPYLKRGGRMAALVIPENAAVGQVYLVQKTMAGESLAQPLFDSYAPYVPGFAPARRFVFA